MEKGQPKKFTLDTARILVMSISSVVVALLVFVIVAILRAQVGFAANGDWEDLQFTEPFGNIQNINNEDEQKIFIDTGTGNLALGYTYWPGSGPFGSSIDLYSGGSWTQPFISPPAELENVYYVSASEAYAVTITVDDILSVSRFNGSGWSTILSGVSGRNAIISRDRQGNIWMASYSEPVAYQGALSVRRYDGSSWTTLISQSYLPDRNSEFNFAFSDTSAYVASWDICGSLYVYDVTGGTLADTGGDIGFIPAYDGSCVWNAELEYNDTTGKWYVAYYDGWGGLTPTIVKEYSGGSWSEIFSGPAAVAGTSIASNNATGAIYIQYYEFAIDTTFIKQYVGGVWTELAAFGGTDLWASDLYYDGNGGHLYSMFYSLGESVHQIMKYPSTGNLLPTPTSTPTPTDTATPTPTPTDTATPTSTPTPTDTAIPTDTPTDTPTDSVTTTPTDTATGSVTVTTTATITGTATVSPTGTTTVTELVDIIVLPPVTDVGEDNTNIEGENGVTCPIFESFHVSSTVVEYGDTVTFSWDTTNATSVTWRENRMSLSSSGTQGFIADTTKTIRLLADNGSCSARVEQQITVLTTVPWKNSTVVGVGALAVEAAIVQISALYAASAQGGAAALQQAGAGIQGNIWLALAGFIDRRRKRKWGVIYDAVTKKPIARAVIRLVEKSSGKVVDVSVSDAQGMIRLQAAVGTYLLQVSHPEYKFPSSLVKLPTDGGFAHIYRGEELKITEARTPIMVSIPMDPVTLTPTMRKKVESRSLIERTGNYGSLTLLGAGFVYGVYAALMYPHLLNYLVVGIYSVLLLSKVALLYIQPKIVGIVRSQNGKVLRNVELGLYDAEFKTLMYRTFTNSKGQYSFAVDNKIYLMRILDERYAILRQRKKVMELLMVPKEQSEAVRYIAEDIVLTN